MNWHNGHLSDIMDTFQTFIGHNHWYLIGDFGSYLAKQENELFTKKRTKGS